jgi:hypothetical protein
MQNAQWNINPDPPLNPLPCQFRLKNIDFHGRGKIHYDYAYAIHIALLQSAAAI